MTPLSEPEEEPAIEEPAAPSIDDISFTISGEIVTKVSSGVYESDVVKTEGNTASVVLHVETLLDSTITYSVGSGSSQSYTSSGISLTSDGETDTEYVVHVTADYGSGTSYDYTVTVSITFEEPVEVDPIT